eukprot:Sspe_Gene.63::Locus_22_Transcript_2_2_Confidence_0.667_Length_3961::g.63::m.63
MAMPSQCDVDSRSGSPVPHLRTGRGRADSPTSQASFYGTPLQQHPSGSNLYNTNRSNAMSYVIGLENTLSNLRTNYNLLRSTFTSEPCQSSNPSPTPSSPRRRGLAETRSASQGLNYLDFESVWSTLTDDHQKKDFARSLHRCVTGAIQSTPDRTPAVEKGLRQFVSAHSMRRSSILGSSRRLLVPTGTEGSYRVATEDDITNQPSQEEEDSVCGSVVISKEHIRAQDSPVGPSPAGIDAQAMDDVPLLQRSHSTEPEQKLIRKVSSDLSTFNNVLPPSTSEKKQEETRHRLFRNFSDDTGGLLHTTGSLSTFTTPYAHAHPPPSSSVTPYHASPAGYHHHETPMHLSELGRRNSDFVPELLISSSSFVRGPPRVESTASIKGHTVIETVKVEKGEDSDGNKRINQYTVIAPLGKGNYAKVKLVQHEETGKEYALKIMNKSILNKIVKGDSTALAQTRVEIAIMKKIAHPRIVKMHEVIDDPAQNKLYLILDYINKGVIVEMSADGECTPIEPARVAKYTRGIVSGLGYLHKHNIIHRDIKPSNILLDTDDNVYLCDFGVSAIVNGDDDRISGVEGTPYFLSPEICRGDGAVHGKVADIWALGVTVYVMLFGKVPFRPPPNSEPRLRSFNTMNAIQNDPVQVPPGTDKRIENLVTRMLNKSPANRITLQGIKEHEFITRCGGRHTSVQYNPIIISDEDVNQAVSFGDNVHPRMHMNSLVSAKQVAHQYALRVRARIRKRKLEKEKEAMRLLQMHKDDSDDDDDDEDAPPPKKNWKQLMYERKLYEEVEQELEEQREEEERRAKEEEERRLKEEEQRKREEEEELRRLRKEEEMLQKKKEEELKRRMEDELQRQEEELRKKEEREEGGDTPHVDIPISVHAPVTARSPAPPRRRTILVDDSNQETAGRQVSGSTSSSVSTTTAASPPGRRKGKGRAKPKALLTLADQRTCDYITIPPPPNGVLEARRSSSEEDTKTACDEDIIEQLVSVRDPASGGTSPTSSDGDSATGGTSLSPTPPPNFSSPLRHSVQQREDLRRWSRLTNGNSTLPAMTFFKKRMGSLGADSATPEVDREPTSAKLTSTVTSDSIEGDETMHWRNGRSMSMCAVSVDQVHNEGQGKSQGRSPRLREAARGTSPFQVAWECERSGTASLGGTPTLGNLKSPPSTRGSDASFLPSPVSEDRVELRRHTSPHPTLEAHSPFKGKQLSPLSPGRPIFTLGEPAMRNGAPPSRLSPLQHHHHQGGQHR